MSVPKATKPVPSLLSRLEGWLLRTLFPKRPTDLVSGGSAPSDSITPQTAAERSKRERFDHPSQNHGTKDDVRRT